MMVTKLTQMDCYPTPIWQFVINNHEQLNHDLLSYIRQKQRENSKGTDSSNILGWHSDYFDNDNQSVLVEFSKIIREPVSEVAGVLKWDLKNFNLTVHECWAIVNKKYASNLIHTHPNSYLSAVYYVRAPKKGGNLFFVDPREVNNVFVPPYTGFTKWNQHCIEVEPQNGLLVIFPSWLKHGVKPNLSEKERIIMSFNVKLVEK